jgi:hypothetical protein
MKNTIINISITLFTLLITIFIGESIFRLYYYYYYNISIFNDAQHGLVVKDDIKGWRLGENLKYNTKLKDAFNNIYNVSVATNEHGFKTFGDPSSSKIKIFFIGDSFTEGVEVSNDKSYHGIIKNTINDIEVFAYGVGGYGNLQEFMVLDENIDIIKPNVIVLQFFWNDFCRNYYKLDRIKFFYNAGTPRPFLNLDGKITYQYVKQFDNFFVTLPTIVTDNLRILKFLNAKLSGLMHKLGNNNSFSNEELQHSAKVTEMIMQMTKKRAGSIPLYLFCVDTKEPYYHMIKNICQSVGIHFIDSVPQRLEQLEKEHPDITKVADKEHLNETGNRVVAEELILFLKQNKIIP